MKTVLLKKVILVVQPNHQENAMHSEKRFDQSVQLAAAFIANGDIRLGQSDRDAQVHERLSDLIAMLYKTLEQARDNVGSHLIPPDPEAGI